jgi:hypothetical protein
VIQYGTLSSVVNCSVSDSGICFFFLFGFIAGDSNHKKNPPVQLDKQYNDLAETFSDEREFYDKEFGGTNKKYFNYLKDRSWQSCP